MVLKKKQWRANYIVVNILYIISASKIWKEEYGGYGHPEVSTIMLISTRGLRHFWFQYSK